MRRSYYLPRETIEDGRRKVTHRLDASDWIEEDELAGDVEGLEERAITHVKRGLGWELEQFAKDYPDAEDVIVETYQEDADCGYYNYNTRSRLAGWVPLTKEDHAFLDLEEKKAEAKKALRAAHNAAAMMREAIKTIQGNAAEVPTSNELVQPLLVQLEELEAAEAVALEASTALHAESG